MDPETKPLVNFRHFIVKYPQQPLVADFPLGSSRNFCDIFKAFRDLDVPPSTSKLDLYL